MAIVPAAESVPASCPSLPLPRAPRGQDSSGQPLCFAELATVHTELTQSPLFVCQSLLKAVAESEIRKEPDSESSAKWKQCLAPQRASDSSAPKPFRAAHQWQ